MTRNDAIMMSLWENADLRETKQIIYQSKGVDESYPKMYFLLNLNNYVKSCGHFGQILAFFTMPAHQIWSYHETQEANFEKFLFSPNSTFNIRKSHKISGGKAPTSVVISQKPHPQGKTPPVLLGLRKSSYI